MCNTFYVSGVTMREKKSGALSKIKKRLSHSFGRLCKYQFRIDFLSVSKLFKTQTMLGLKLNIDVVIEYHGH